MSSPEPKSVKISGDVYALLQEIAEREDRNITAVIKRAVRLYDMESQAKDALLDRWAKETP